MPFETTCRGCGRPLRVADEHAGKKARCPHCGEIFDVPPPLNGAAPSPSMRSPLSPESGAGAGAGSPAAAGSSGPSLAGSSLSGPSSPSSEPLWMLRTEDGTAYGPVPKAELDKWAAEGRITAQAHVGRIDADEWLSAPDVYPWLRGSRPTPPPTPGNAANYSRSTYTPAGATSNHVSTVSQAAPQGSNSPGQTPNPFRDQPSAVRNNPYAVSGAQHGPASNLTAHRGGMLLTFGILSMFCCALFGPPAWLMAQHDLREMREGRMDSSGLGLTQAGMILGIIGSIQLLCGFGLVAIQILGSR